MDGNVFAARPVFRPTFTPPAPRLSSPASLGQDGALIAAGSALALISGALGAVATYVGIDYGINQKGFKSFLGWAVGVLGGVRVLASIGFGIGAIAVGAQAQAPSENSP